MNPLDAHRLQLTRRELFGRSATGLGVGALASLLEREGFSAAPAPAPRYGGLPDLPHMAAKAKHVIYLFQNGAPTHCDLYDYKPMLQQLHGQPMPEEFFKGKRFSTMTGDPTGKLVLAPVEPFAQHGESGAWVFMTSPRTRMAASAGEAAS